MRNNSISFLIKNGFLHIFSSNVLNKIIQFCSGVVLIRLFSKETYGQWTYANNILSFFLLFEGLGVCNSLLQFGSESSNSERHVELLRYSLKYGLIVDIALSFLILFISTIIDLPIKGSSQILLFSSLIPVFSVVFNIYESFLRATLRNSLFSILSVVHTGLTLICMILGVYFYDIYGAIIGRYFAWIIVDFIALIFIKKDCKTIVTKITFDNKEKKEFNKYAFITTASNSLSSILYLIDTFLVGIVIKDTIAVASYKTATLIPFAIDFIPLSIMTFFYPYFAKENKNIEKIRHRYLKLLKYLGLLNFFISTFLFALAPILISFLFGRQYTDSVLPFRILAIGYFFAGTFRIPAGNILGCLRMVKVNLFVSVVSGILNIILDILFINLWGPVGAAISTFSIFLVSCILSNSYVFIYFKKKTI